MAETVAMPATKRLAVVTGANKGIGLEICLQLAVNGVVVILTARDEKRGLQAVENLKGSGLSDVIFHQLDVGNPDSVASLASFIKTQFGKLDILVNNAGIIGGAISDADAFRAAAALGASGTEAMKPNWKGRTGKIWVLTAAPPLSESLVDERQRLKETQILHSSPPSERA